MPPHRHALDGLLAMSAAAPANRGKVDCFVADDRIDDFLATGTFANHRALAKVKQAWGIRIHAVA